jgi:hypothetical protein
VILTRCAGVATSRSFRQRSKRELPRRRSDLDRGVLDGRNNQTQPLSPCDLKCPAGARLPAHWRRRPWEGLRRVALGYNVTAFGARDCPPASNVGGHNSQSHRFSFQKSGAFPSAGLPCLGTRNARPWELLSNRIF